MIPDITLPSWCAVLLLTFLSATSSPLALRAQDDDNTELFESKLKGGYEAGMILEQTQSADGQIAILYTARKKGTKPSKWPLLLKNFHYIGTIAEGDADCESENWIVSLPDKRRIGVISGGKNDLAAFHPDDHRRKLAAAWSPPDGAARVGLVAYSSDAESEDVILVGFDSGALKTASLLKILNNATDKFMVQQKSYRKDKTYQHLYSVARTGIEKAALPAGATTVCSIGFKGVVGMDRGDETPPIDAAVSVRITNGKDGVLNAKIEGVTSPGAAPATASAASSDSAPATAEQFAALRKKMNAISDGDTWKAVHKDLPKDTKGQRHYVTGWVQGTGLKMMMHVKADNDKDKIVTAYYYHEGSLVSVFEIRKGDYTEISEVAEVSETYNFINEKLVSWSNYSSLGTESFKPGDPGFAEKGEAVRDLAIEYSTMIFSAIKAD